MNVNQVNEKLFVKKSFKQTLASICNVNTLKSRLPFLQWITSYSFKDFRCDMIAGLSVSFTLIPQALAMAILADLPIQYGLYSSFVGPFLYTIFGSCKSITVGPTSIMALITSKYTQIGGANFAVYLSLTAGIVQLLCGFLHLGFLVDFISFPVISAFTSAAALTIIFAQLKPLLGVINIKHFNLFTNFNLISLNDTLLGALCLIALIILRLISDYFKRVRLEREVNKRTPLLLQNQNKSKFFASIVKFLLTSRNILIVFISMAAAYSLPTGTFRLTQKFEPGLPQFHLPRITNGTYFDSFMFAIEKINGGIVIAAFLSILETIAIAKSLQNIQRISDHNQCSKVNNDNNKKDLETVESNSNNNNMDVDVKTNTNATMNTNESNFGKKSFDATQEMIVLGLSNVIGSFFGSFPVTGSFSRSAINHSSGVRTQASNFITGCFVLFSLSPFISSTFDWIPETTLASIIIASVIFLIKPKDIFLLMKSSSRIDLLPFAVTFFISIIFTLEDGIIAGIVLSLIIIIGKLSRPVIKFQVHQVKRMPYLIIQPKENIFYFSSDYFRHEIISKLNHLTNIFTSSQRINQLDDNFNQKTIKDAEEEVEEEITTEKVIVVEKVDAEEERETRKADSGIGGSNCSIVINRDIATVDEEHDEICSVENNVNENGKCNETIIIPINNETGKLTIPVLIDCGCLINHDTTFIESLCDLNIALIKEKIDLYFFNINENIFNDLKLKGFNLIDCNFDDLNNFIENKYFLK